MVSQRGIMYGSFQNRGDVVEITEEYNEEKELSWRGTSAL